MMLLMGTLEGIRPNLIKLCLHIDLGTQKNSASNYRLSSSLMHSRSINLEGEKKFGYYTKKLNIIIGSPQDSH